MPTKTPPKKKNKKPSTAFCFGTLNSEEWHVDFSLLPKDVRYYAGLKFIAAVKSPQVYRDEAFVYDRALGAVSIRRQRGKRVDVGDIVPSRPG